MWLTNMPCELVETPFKVLSIESKNGMVLVVRMKVTYDGVTLKPKERVYEILTRRLENLSGLVEIPRDELSPFSMNI